MVERTRVSACVAIVLVGVVCLSAGTASAAVGDVDSGTVQFSHSNNESYDAHLDSGGLYWGGQAVVFDDANDVIDADQLLLREYDATTDEVGSLVREIEFDGNGTVLDTEGFEGTYVLVPTDDRETALVFEDGSVSGNTSINNATPFEVLTQTLEVGWEGGDAGTVSADRELEVESNRVRYNVNVSSPSLSYAELEKVFMGDRSLRADNRPFTDRRPFDKRYGMYDTYEDEDIIVLRGFSDGTLKTDFSRIDSFPDAVTVEVTDTGAMGTTDQPTEAPESGAFKITELGVSDAVDPGEPVTIEATVTNEWPSTESREIVFELGETSASVQTSLESGASTTVSTTLVAPSEAGEINYAATTDGDRVEGTVMVGDPSANTENENNESSDDGGNTGLIGTAIGLLYPQGLIGTVMTLLSVAGYVVWQRR